ncbi:MAG: dihydrodipicolinate synthase family protein [Gammaproteobacteria bacterium]
MKYTRNEAKEYAREHMRGIWAAALNPFSEDTLSINEPGMRSNIRHWVDDLDIQGLFIAGKQGEFFSMSMAERKRNFEIAVDETGDKAQTIMSCSDQNFDTVIELAKHAENVGADYIVVHAPMLHFITDQDDTVFNYYNEVCRHINIGVAMWSHPDSGYLMSPELCARVAEIPNIVSIKYSVPRAMYSRLSKMVGDTLLVSTAAEGEWLDNIEELGWQLYLCSSPPYLLQTKNDRRMHEYTRLAFQGEFAKARIVKESLEPVRQALKNTRPADKPQAHQKYWQELLGQTGGPVRSPLLQLTEREKEATKAAFDACGLRL